MIRDELYKLPIELYSDEVLEAPFFLYFSKFEAGSSPVIPID